MVKKIPGAWLSFSQNSISPHRYFNRRLRLQPNSSLPNTANRHRCEMASPFIFSTAFIGSDTAYCNKPAL